jgi:hypothetical protein
MPALSDKFMEKSYSCKRCKHKVWLLSEKEINKVLNINDNGE